MDSFNILFYSTRCDACRRLIIIMKNENLIPYFKLICVDDKLNRLPPQIQAVPTMLIKGVKKPLVCEETFKWIEQVKFLRKQNIQTDIKNINQSYKKNSDIIGFDEDTMNGISDKFAFTEDDVALPHTYFNVGDEDKNIIFTAPENDTVKTRDQINLINNLKNIRNEQEKKYIEQYQKEHNDILKKNVY